MVENRYQNLKIAERGARISIAAYILLSIAKLVTGYLTNSKALTADGLNNTTDIFGSVAVLIGLRISRKPADDDHPYGHFRAETIASLIASIIMMGVGINVIYNGIQSIVINDSNVPGISSAIVAFISGVAIYFVHRYNKKIALKINSRGLLAAAKDNLADSWVSFGAAIGIVGAQFGYTWLDPLIAVLVGVLIIKTGVGIFRESTHNLTDGFNKEELKKIYDLIYTVEDVLTVKDVKARTHGSNMLIDAVIGVNPDLTIEEGHQITEQVETKVKEHYEIIDIIVHVEPIDKK